jgi:hypothetical protein
MAAAGGGQGDRELRRVTKALAALGICFVELSGDGLGAGVGLTRADAELLVLSVPRAAGSVLNVTAGVLKQVPHERCRLLELCNSLTRDNAACPVYLHDAPDGWDLHIQQRYLIELLLAAPWYLRACVENLPAVAKSARSKFRVAGIGGEPYTWNMADAHRLLTRSLI